MYLSLFQYLTFYKATFERLTKKLCRRYFTKLIPLKMSTAQLLFALLLLTPCTLGWYTKHFTTGFYDEMVENGTLKDLKSLTYEARMDWDNMNGGYKCFV